MNALLSYISSPEVVEKLRSAVGTWAACRESLGSGNATKHIVNSIFKRLLTTRLEGFVAGPDDTVVFAPTKDLVQVHVTSGDIFGTPKNRWNPPSPCAFTVFNSQGEVPSIESVVATVREKGDYFLAVSPTGIAVADIRELPDTAVVLGKSSAALCIGQEDWVWSQVLVTPENPPVTSYNHVLDSVIEQHADSDASRLSSFRSVSTGVTEEEEVSLAQGSDTWKYVQSFYEGRAALSCPTLEEFIANRRETLEQVEEDIRKACIGGTLAADRMKSLRTKEKNDLRATILRPLGRKLKAKCV